MDPVLTKKYKVKKWIYFSIALLLNTFIIFQASLPGEVSKAFSNFFYNIARNIANFFSPNTAKVIPVSDISLRYDDTYLYNAIEGYNNNEIVIGTNKLLTTDIYPIDATNRSIKYSLSDDSIRIFIDKINKIPGITIAITGSIKDLKQQDYKGKRVYVIIKDEAGYCIQSKIDLGVHKDLDIKQEE